MSDPEFPMKKQNCNVPWQNYFTASCISVKMNHLILRNIYSG